MIKEAFGGNELDAIIAKNSFRYKFPKDKNYFKEDKNFLKEKKLIENLFPKNPGSMEHYWLPTNHKDVQKF